MFMILLVDYSQLLVIYFA